MHVSSFLLQLRLISTPVCVCACHAAQTRAGVRVHRLYSTDNEPNGSGEDVKTKTKWSEVRKKQKEQYHDGWQPQKKLTRYQMDFLRTLKQDQPEEWTVAKLSTKFGISSSAVVRILKSRFDPPRDVKDRQDKKALEVRDRRRNVVKQIAMDDGEKEKQTQVKYKKPNHKDLIIDFDT